MKRFLTALFILPFTFLSCSNFITGSDFKNQLKNDIDYANSKSIEIRLEANSESGEFLTDKNLTKKAGDTFTLEFKLSPDYQMVKWTAFLRDTNTELSSDYITFISTDNVSSDNIYKVNVKLLKESDSITIKPVCYLLPKIIKILPSYSNSGDNQDSTIQIFFNKAPELENKDIETFFTPLITITDIKEDTLNDYYLLKNAYFTNDNTTLNIPTDKSKRLIEEDSSTLVKEIKITILSQYIKDENNIAFAAFEPYVFRLNKNIDSVKPLLEEVTLFSTKSEESPYYKILSPLSLSEGEIQEAAYFSQNHINSSFYAKLKGYDSDSGIRSVRIHSSRLYSFDGSPCTDFVTNDIEVAEEDGFFSFEYQLDNLEDGIIKVDFYLLDYAENISEENISYYIIKDSSFRNDGVKIFNKLPEAVDDKYSLYGEGSVNECVKKMYITVGKDLYASYNHMDYSSKKEDIEIELYTKKGSQADYTKYTNLEENPDSTSDYTFMFNDFSAEDDSFIKIILRDEVGNTYQREYLVPKSPTITDIKSGSGTFTYTSGEQTGHSDFTITFNSDFTTLSDQEKPLAISFSAIQENCGLIDPYGYNYNSYRRELTYKSAGTPVYYYKSGQDYLSAACMCGIIYDYFDENKHTIYGQTGDPDFYVTLVQQANLFASTGQVSKPNFTFTASPGPKNSCIYNINVNAENYDSDSILSVGVILPKRSEPSFYNYPSFEISNSKLGQVSLFVRAKRLIDGKYYYIDSDSQTFEMDTDVSPPTLSDNNPNYTDDGQKVYCYDVYDSVALLFDENDLFWVSYWILPYKDIYSYDKSSITEEYIRNQNIRERKTCISKEELEDTGELFFDVSNTPPGTYTLVTKAYDKAGNTHFGYEFFFNIDTPPVQTSITSAEKNGNQIYLSTSFSLDETEALSTYGSVYEKTVVEKFNKTNKCWEVISTNGARDSFPLLSNFTLNSTNDDFFRIYTSLVFNSQTGLEGHSNTYSIYYYSGDQEITNKGIAILNDKVAAIKCNNSCLVTTAVSSIPYEDAKDWERYATKKNTEILNYSDFYFMATDDIDCGDYYTSLVIYSDGSIAIGEIKEKE